MTGVRAIQRVVAIDHETEVLDRLRDSVSSSVLLETFSTAQSALQYIRSSADVDVVICGVSMPDLEGVGFLRRVKDISEDIQVVAIADYDSIDAGVEFVHNGAFSYILKPFSLDELRAMLGKIDEFKVCQATQRQLGGEFVRREGHFYGLVGNHPLMRQLFEKVRSTGNLQSRTNILIQGESGTGKELVARAIHRLGPTRDEPFVAVNCAAINENLLEDQLFGHVSGAFTGASTDREGCFVSSGNGTVFLDEIGELPLELQAKLLRAVQEREVYPLGSDRPVTFRARLIAASNRNLAGMAERKTFRRDLFYRLNVIRIEVPPLRKRLDDVPLLAEFFLNRFYRESRRRKRLDAAALDVLRRYSYPGNVRELENAVEYAYALGMSDLISPRDLPVEFLQEKVETEEFMSLARVEREHLVRALHAAKGKKVAAAKLLRIDRNRLYRLIQKYQIKASEIQLG